MASVAGKVVLITGVARGCGKVLAESLASEGAKIVGCDIDEAGLNATREAITSSGGTATLVTADVSDEQQVASLVETAVGTYGGLDAAVNNAGTETTGMVEQGDPAVLDRLVAVNLEG